MILNSSQINRLDSKERLKLINGIAGIKPANIIGTINEDGITNAAIFSSVVHIGSNPPLVGFILRPQKGVSRHSYSNIIQKGVFTINQVHASYVKNAHCTSGKFDAQTSEFDTCQLTPEYIDGFEAPFVKESLIKTGLSYKKSISIDLNDTTLVIGQIIQLIIPDELIDNNGYIDIQKAKTVGVGGLNSYYSLAKIIDLPYVRQASSLDGDMII